MFEGGLLQLSETNLAPLVSRNQTVKPSWLLDAECIINILDEERVRGAGNGKYVIATLWANTDKEFLPPPYQNINSIWAESKSLITCIDCATPCNFSAARELCSGICDH